jgi:hypothetical protein
MIGVSCIISMSTSQGSSIRRSTLRNVISDDESDVCYFCNKDDPGKGSDNIDWINCDLCEEWFYVVCAKVPVSSDDNTVYTCRECARSNRQTAELKLFITESITTNIADLKQDFADFRMWTESEITELNDKVKTVGTEIASQRVKIKTITKGGGARYYPSCGLNGE